MKSICSDAMNPNPTTDPSVAESLGPWLSEFLVIAAGGALGASLRYATALATHAASQHSLWATATVNWLGAFLLGLLVARVDSPNAHPLLRPFLLVGVFGSFTTFSALALDNRLLATESGEAVALLHLAGSVALGLFAFAAGSVAAGGRR